MKAEQLFERFKILNEDYKDKLNIAKNKADHSKEALEQEKKKAIESFNNSKKAFEEVFGKSEAKNGNNKQQQKRKKDYDEIASDESSTEKNIQTGYKRVYNALKNFINMAKNDPLGGSGKKWPKDTLELAYGNVIANLQKVSKAEKSLSKISGINPVADNFLKQLEQHSYDIRRVINREDFDDEFKELNSQLKEIKDNKNFTDKEKEDKSEPIIKKLEILKNQKNIDYKGLIDILVQIGNIVPEVRTQRVDINRLKKENNSKALLTKHLILSDFLSKKYPKPQEAYDKVKNIIDRKQADDNEIDKEVSNLNKQLEMLGNGENDVNYLLNTKIETQTEKEIKDIIKDATENGATEEDIKEVRRLAQKAKFTEKAIEKLMKIMKGELKSEGDKDLKGARSRSEVATIYKQKSDSNKLAKLQIEGFEDSKSYLKAVGFPTVMAKYFVGDKNIKWFQSGKGKGTTSSIPSPSNSSLKFAQDDGYFLLSQRKVKLSGDKKLFPVNINGETWYGYIVSRKAVTSGGPLYAPYTAFKNNSEDIINRKKNDADFALFTNFTDEDKKAVQEAIDNKLKEKKSSVKTTFKCFNY